MDIRSAANTDTAVVVLPGVGRSAAARRVVLAVLGLLAVVGLPVLFYRLGAGLGVTRLGSGVPWGLWVAFYIYFIGLSAGSFLLSTLIYVFKNEKLEPLGRLAVLQAFVCLVTGMTFILVDLGHWERFWHPLVYPQWRSVLTWEIWAYLIYTAVLLAELWFLMRCDLARWAEEARWEAQRLYKILSLGFHCPTNEMEWRVCDTQTRRWLMILGVIGIPVALLVHGGTGAIFAVVKARPAWYTPIFPVVFIVSALASGGGLLLLLRTFLAPRSDNDRDTLCTLARLTGGFLVLDLGLLFLEFLVGTYGGIPDHVAPYRLMAFGPFWWVFWVQQLLLGAVVPLLLIYIRTDRAGAFRLGLAGLLIILGIFGVRLNIVIPALAAPILPGFDHALASARLSSLYVANWVEWLSSLGIVAAAALAALAAMRLLPMTEHQPYSSHVWEARDVRV
ncbi:MAG: polysulfide reductase NrfD [Armatimonadetes bacterium]|nr:polysulfide reductase NrfD [Armatimonadota bacterium]